MPVTSPSYRRAKGAAENALRVRAIISRTKRNSSKLPQSAVGRNGLEVEADRVAEATVTGSRANVTGAAGLGSIQYSTLSDAVRLAADKGRVFDAMHRDLLSRVFLADPATATPGAFGTATPMCGLSNPPRRAR